MSLHGGGVSIRSFIHINDVVDATLKLTVEVNQVRLGIYQQENKLV